MAIKKCKICGKEFLATVTTKTICSVECKVINNRLNNKMHMQKKREEKRKELGTKKCPVCGKEFVPRNDQHKRCSQECTQKIHNDYKREYIRVTKKQLAEEKKMREKNGKELVKMSVEAGNAHTTYGKLELQNYLLKQSFDMERRRRELDAEWERKRNNGNK